MNNIRQFTESDVDGILDHGKSWFPGKPPSILHIEDQRKTQEMLADRLEDRFAGIAAVTADSIEAAKEVFHAGSRYDFVVLDHILPLTSLRHDQASAAQLADFLEYVVRVGETACGFLIRYTAYLESATLAKEIVEARYSSGGGRNQFSRLSCLIEKNVGWEEMILAYMYRHLALSAHERLQAKFDCFDLTRLNGTKPTARPRNERLSGTEDFDAFVKELSAWWLFLGTWPADSLATEKLLSPLVNRTRHFFTVDTSDADAELAEGEARLTLKYRPGPYRPISVTDL